MMNDDSDSDDGYDDDGIDSHFLLLAPKVLQTSLHLDTIQSNPSVHS